MNVLNAADGAAAAKRGTPSGRSAHSTEGCDGFYTFYTVNKNKQKQNK